MGEDKEVERIRKRKLDAMQASAREPKVVVYSTPACPYCTMAKAYLAERRIGFTEYDVSKDQERAREMVAKSRQTGVPVLEVNGRIIVGFDREKIDLALARAPPPARRDALGNLFYDPFNI